MIHPVGIIILAGVFNRGSRFLGTLKTKEDRQIADVFNKRHEICFSLSLLWGIGLRTLLRDDSSWAVKRKRAKKKTCRLNCESEDLSTSYRAPVAAAQ